MRTFKKFKFFAPSTKNTMRRKVTIDCKLTLNDLLTGCNTIKIRTNQILIFFHKYILKDQNLKSNLY